MSDRLIEVEVGFKKDVETHAMAILKDDGVYRHLRFKRPDSWCMGFDLVTWPGHLAYTGDMGEFLFSRLHDMLQFFRQPLDQGISYAYWAEKCKAGDRTGRRDSDGVYEFSEEAFKEAVLEDFESWREANEGLFTEDPPFLDEVKERLEDEVLSCSNEGVVRAYDAATAFEVAWMKVFPDFWEHSCEEYTERFVWCCNAIRWGVARYDALKELNNYERVYNG